MEHKNIFTHKFLPILGLAFFVLFILLINNSFASINFNYNDINYSFPDFNSDKPFYITSGNLLSTPTYDAQTYASMLKLDTSIEYFYILRHEYSDIINTNGTIFMLCYLSDEGKIVVAKNPLARLLGSSWCNDTSIYSLSEDSKEWILSNSNSFGDRYGSVIYSTLDIYEVQNSSMTDFDTSVIYFNGTTFTSTFYLSNTDLTFSYPQILSKQFDYENLNNYEAYISLDDKNWDSFNIEYVNINEDGFPQYNSPFVYYYNIFENGNYHIRLFDNSTGLYIYDDYIAVTNLAYEIILEPEEETDKPIIAKTNLFDSISSDFICYYSTDKKEWQKMNWAMEEPAEDGSVVYGSNYYWTRIFKNGIYYFKFVKFIEHYENEELINVETEEYFVTKNIKNLIVEDYMSDDYIFKPIISLDYNKENESFIIRTQSILLDKALNLNCFYISYEKNDSFNPNEIIEDTEITSWNKMEIDFENNIYMNSSDAYFYFEIPIINAVDTNYKIAFYNYFSNKSSEIVYYDFIYEDSKNYVENDLNVHLGVSVYLNDLLRTFEDRLGILGFPLSVVRQFSHKILTLQSREPVIYIPELREPFYNNKIYNGTSFNFNSLLVSDSVIFIHEFYLTIVDMIFIFLFLVYCINTLKSFINKYK